MKNKYIDKRVKLVEQWLDKNVKVYKDVKKLVMYNFDINWKDFDGSFDVEINEEAFDMKYKFSCLTITGKPEIYFPVFHSPLGVPASYGAIEISESVKSRMIEELAKVLPPMRSLGFHKDLGVYVTNLMPQSIRYPSEDIINKSKQLFSNKDFKIDIHF